MIPFDSTRRHRRFSVDVMDIKGDAVFASEVVICDISITGVSLKTDRVLEMGREYVLRIFDKELDLPVQGTVIWRRENEAAGAEKEPGHLKYTAGLRFTALKPEYLSSLIAFIEAHLLDEHKPVKVNEVSGLRCNIRFPLNVQETAVLNITETYLVKELSLGGLLIDSSNSLDPGTRIHMGMTLSKNMRLSFLGRVVFCSASPDKPSCFEIGIEFIGMPEPDRAALKEFILHLYLEDAGFSSDGIIPNAHI